MTRLQLTTILRDDEMTGAATYGREFINLIDSLSLKPCGAYHDRFSIRVAGKSCSSCGAAI